MTEVSTTLLKKPKIEKHSQLYWAFSNSTVLTSRSLKHIFKNMDQLMSITIMPIMFLLLFRYVFGGAINTGGTTYVNFLIAGILVQTLAFGASTTTLNVVLDLQRGIVDRFRSLPVFASSLLIGHVVADLVRNAISGAVMIGVGFLVGFRPNATLIEWLYVIGLVLLFTFAVSWLSAILGLLVKTLEAAQWVSFVLIFPLTFASSAFVPTEGMPKALRIFAENQPFTLVIEAIRGWLVGTPVGDNAWMATIWLVGIIVVCAPLATWMFKRFTSK